MEMGWQAMDRITTRTASHSSADGFSLIEVIIATAILAGGLLTLAGFLAQGMRYMAGSSPNLIAREKAREAVESVHTARDTGLLSWTRIQNVAAGGVFLAGAQPLTTAGPDGLVNTADDGGVEMLRTPGPDGILGNTDDIQTPLTNFTREIQIAALNKDGSTIVNPNLRQITVILRYTIDGFTRNYTLVTYVSSFS
jgi:prepilin-type N-terminal cleavage/methylation domain-containing protein